MRKLFSTVIHHAPAHVLACIDGKKKLTWLVRAHRIGHLIYFGTITFGFAEIHEHIVGLMFLMELVSVVAGKDEMRDAVLEFE